jgi:hypothetical protein
LGYGQGFFNPKKFHYNHKKTKNMDHLKLAQEKFPAADKAQRKILTEIFGDALIQKITDRIKTYKDACDALKVDAYIDDSVLSKDEIAYIKLKRIIAVLNEGWTPDYNDSNEVKYHIWWKWNGSGFSFYAVDLWYSTTTAGSRLCFKSPELAEYAAKQFESIFNDFLSK